MGSIVILFIFLSCFYRTMLDQLKLFYGLIVNIIFILQILEVCASICGSSSSCHRFYRWGLISRLTIILVLIFVDLSHLSLNASDSFVSLLIFLFFPHSNFLIDCLSFLSNNFTSLIHHSISFISLTPQQKIKMMFN